MRGCTAIAPAIRPIAVQWLPPPPGGEGRHTALHFRPPMQWLGTHLHSQYFCQTSFVPKIPRTALLFQRSARKFYKQNPVGRGGSSSIRPIGIFTATPMVTGEVSFAVLF